MSGYMVSLLFTREHFGTMENSKVSVLSAGAWDEAERFIHVIVFRVVFKATIKKLKAFKKRSPPYHTHGKPTLMNTRRKQFL